MVVVEKKIGSGPPRGPARSPRAPDAAGRKRGAPLPEATSETGVQPGSAIAPGPAKSRPTNGNGRSSVLQIVGVGASAGGLEAFTELLSHLPDDTGMAFVLI